uniref:SFRICE_035004 n=1 Tax=Spodoptera frugiperda TaxID=7108 RepID=A0A2H1WFQ6_SPOFR
MSGPGVDVRSPNEAKLFTYAATDYLERGSSSKSRSRNGVWPLLTKGLFSHGEGLSINHHACLVQAGTYRDRCRPDVVSEPCPPTLAVVGFVLAS